MEFSHNGFQLNVNDTLKFVSPEEILAWKTEVQKANEFLMNKNGKGREFLGWMSLPSDIIKKSI